MNLLSILSDLFYPPRCPCCGKLKSDGQPCETCEKGLTEQLLEKPLCKRCVNEKRLCQCGEYNPLFMGAAAVFFNDGTAKQGIYGLKFRKRSFAASFFADKMSDKFLEVFPNVKPDVVCIVPTYKKDLIKRDYDQVDLLGKAVAKWLDIKYEPKLLEKTRRTKRQHSLPKSERAANVKGAYKATSEINNKCVLLIDDIKTTGFTLNECSKQLRLAGAKEVYCLTALISPNKSCK